MMSSPIGKATAADAVVHGASAAPEPLAALSAALVAAAAAMSAEGATSPDLIEMTWTSRCPARIHPASRAVDLLFREIFGGVRPEIAVHTADHDGVRVLARLRCPRPVSSVPVWGGLTATELAGAYSTRAVVRNMPAVFNAWRTDGAAFRAAHLAVELSYGPSANETVDLYLPQSVAAPRPLWIFIHGGFWQALDKAHNAHFAAGMLAAGYAVAMPNYSLAPDVTLQQIVHQIQAAVSFLAREAPALGCDPREVHISGHSAGGHLAAMIAALPEGRLIRSCLPLSGLFDVAPLAALAMGPLLGLTGPTVVETLSPVHLKPLPHVRIGAAVGGFETAEFQRQTVDFAKAWGLLPCRILPGQNHFDLLDGLKSGELLSFAKDIAQTRY